MPAKTPMEQAREAAHKGKAPSTQAGEFVREEIRHVREGKHGARSTKQVIAIGLAKARRAGVKLRPPRQRSSVTTRAQAVRDYRKGQTSARQSPSPTRSHAIVEALKREAHQAASPAALSRQTRSAARRRGTAARRRAARQALKTKGREGLKRAARKAALTRARRKG